MSPNSIYQKVVENRRHVLEEMREEIGKYYRDSLVPLRRVYLSKDWSNQPFKGLSVESVALKAFKERLEEARGEDLVILDFIAGKASYTIDVLELMDREKSIELLALPRKVRWYILDYFDDAAWKGRAMVEDFLSQRKLGGKVEVFPLVGMAEFVDVPERAHVVFARLAIKEIPRKWKPYVLARLLHDFMEAEGLLFLSEPMIDREDVLSAVRKVGYDKVLLHYPSLEGKGEDEVANALAVKLSDIMEVFHNNKYVSAGSYLSMRSVDRLEDMERLLEGLGAKVVGKEKRYVDYFLPDAWVNQFADAAQYVDFGLKLISAMENCVLGGAFFNFKRGTELEKEGQGRAYVAYKGVPVERLYFHLPFWTLIVRGPKAP